MDQRSKKLLTLLENDCTLNHTELAAMCDTTVEDIDLRDQEPHGGGRHSWAIRP